MIEAAHVNAEYGPQPGQTARMDRTPPQNIELEMCVLGGIMLDPQHAYPVAADYLSREAFYLDGHGVIFQLMGELYHRGTPPDSDMVLDELRARDLLDKVGGAAVILSMLNSVPSAASVEYHARKIAEKAHLRAMIRMCTQVIEECYRQEMSLEQVTEQLEQSTIELSHGLSNAQETAIIPALDRYWADLVERHKERLRLSETGQPLPTGTGIPGGMVGLDQVTGGFRAGEVTILAARPSMGKTALAVNFINHAACQLRIPTLLFSLEMPQEQLLERLLSLKSKHWEQQRIQGTAGRELQSAEIPENGDWKALNQANDQLHVDPVYISDSMRTLAQVKAVSRQHKVKHDIGLIVADYLQLVEGSKEHREQEVSEISRGCKAIARELKVPVILLSQLNRESERDKGRRPRLSDLRESGAIEQDADVVMFLHNPDYQGSKVEQRMCSYCPGDIVNGRCNKCRTLWTTEYELIVAKNRNGPTDIVKLAHIPAIYWFGAKSNRKP